MVTEKAVESIRTATKELGRATARRNNLVRRARDNGATWTQIGYALGVSAQAAQQKFGNTQERVDAHKARSSARNAKRVAKAASKETSEG